MSSIFYLLLVGSVLGFQHHYEAIDLNSISTLTLSSDMMASSRRYAPTPQLACTGPHDLCASYSPSVIQCKNVGWDGIDVQWEFNADLDN